MRIQKNCGKYYADPEHIALGGYIPESCGESGKKQ